ncbi:MAG TPA: hypothetical protein VK427_13150, partial [Kofleriaceae bacterium]|nr:hypothetical protein [Kofleriaceae bacterium]
MLRAALVGLLVIHGLIHAIGFASAYGFSTGPFEKPVSAAAGIAWLVTAVLFICATLLVLVRMRYWGFPAAAGIVLSQVLITMWWHDARFGTIANVLLVCPI